MVSAQIVSQVETNPADFSDFSALYGLLSTAYAEMHGVISPPTSLHGMTPESLAAKTQTEDLFLLRRNTALVGCLFATPTPDGRYYLGKLAVPVQHRRTGAATALLEAAACRAAALGLHALELGTRVELRGNHRLFRKLGFSLVGASAHPGFDRATSLTFRRPVPRGQPLPPGAPLS